MGSLFPRQCWKPLLGVWWASRKLSLCCAHNPWQDKRSATGLRALGLESETQGTCHMLAPHQALSSRHLQESSLALHPGVVALNKAPFLSGPLCPYL